MADVKKFLDSAGTGYLWSKIKAQLDTKATTTEVEAINTKLGTLPSGKTDFASWIESVAASAGDVTALEALKDRVETIEDDYLTSTDKTTLEGLIDSLETACEAKYAAIAYADTVDTLVGSDTSKSVRAIANEELAAQLIADDADASLDTLQEIAAWIQSHPGDAAAMNQAIQALQDLVGDTSVASQIEAAGHATAASVLALEGRVDTAESDIDTLESSVASNTSAIATIKDGASIDSFADVETALAGKQATIAANTYDVYGAAAAVLGNEGDAASAATVYGAKAYAASLSSNYATAAQGAKADTALQAADVIALTNSEIDTAIATANA